LKSSGVGLWWELTTVAAKVIGVGLSWVLGFVLLAFLVAAFVKGVLYFLAWL
jgi:hypothetical protein